MRHRIVSIFGGSIGNLIEWYDFYVYNFFALYFAKSFFPNATPTVQLLNTFGIYALGFLIRPVGGWVLGRLCRPGRAQGGADAVGADDVPGLAADRGRAGLCQRGHLGAGAAAGGAADPGHFARRRIRHLGDLSERDRRLAPSRLLQQFPVCHADRRAGAGQPDAAGHAAGVRPGAAGGLGLAGAVPDRRGLRAVRPVSARQPAGDRAVHARQPRAAARRAGGAAAPSEGRCCWCSA